MASLSKQRYRVVNCTSQDDDFPVEELNHASPSTNGWQSVRFCTWPQELGFELEAGECRFSQLQILSHQAKISSKIELFVGEGSSYHTANFTRLGYLSLDSNERSNYTARELKTVFVDHVGRYVKLLINENHVNKHNIYNQVGIVAISVIGTELGDGSLDDSSVSINDNDNFSQDAKAMDNRERERNSSSHNSYNPRQSSGGGGGGGRAAGGSGGPTNPYTDLGTEMTVDPTTAAKLQQLAEAKARAIDAEDYLTAKQIKSVEQDLKTLGSKLAQLNMAKSDAVMNEDYDLAKEIKDETDQLKFEIEDRIAEIEIPSVRGGIGRDGGSSSNPRRNASPKHSSNRFANDDDNNNINNNNSNNNSSNNKNRSNNRPDSRGFPNPGVGSQQPGSWGINNKDPYSGSSSAGSSGGGPLNVDDLPVGVHHRSQQQQQQQHQRGNGNNSNSSTSRTEVKNSDNDRFSERNNSNNDRNRDRDAYTASAAVTSSPPAANKIGAFDDDDEYSNIPIEDRPIKPKPARYSDSAGLPGANLDDVAERPSTVDDYPRGQHPLEGVPNFADLQEPEALVGKSKELSEAGLINLIGEYRSRCVLSRTWALREAAFAKVHLMMPELVPDDITSNLSTFVSLIKLGVEDKIQQVLFNAITVMDDVLKESRRCRVPRATIAPLFDPIIHHLLEKLNDGNPRIREGARKGLEIIAASGNVGPAVVASHGLKPLPAKIKTAWRPITARLQLLADLVKSYGIGSNSGISVESVLNFPKSVSAYAHSSAEVRDAARDLIVAIYAVTGGAPLEATLNLLRPKQKEEYTNAFEAVDRGANSNSNYNNNNNNSNNNSSSNNNNNEKRTDKEKVRPSQMPGGRVNTSAAKSEDTRNDKQQHPGKGHTPASQGSNNNDNPDFTSCMFCNVGDVHWTENDLDMHYWKDCPLLISCPSCAQIVEIAGLPEHLLDECDARNSYVSCEVTGLAVRRDELSTWKNGAHCTPAPPNCMFCPLCLASVEDSDDAWMQHLTTGCPRNGRTADSYRD